MQDYSEFLKSINIGWCERQEGQGEEHYFSSQEESAGIISSYDLIEKYGSALIKNI